MDGTPIREIGDKIGAKTMSFYSEKYDRLRSVWIPHIEVDGKMLPIRDKSTESGIKESETRKQALFIARQVRDQQKIKIAEQERENQ